MNEEQEVLEEAGGETPAVPVVTPELESARKEAKRFGHQTLEAWEASGKDPANWVDADVFLERGREYNGYLRQQNERLQGQINELGESLKALQEHHTKVAQHAYEKALKELKDSRKTALKEGNLELVAELEEHIEAAEADRPAATPAPKAPADPRQDPVFNAWLADNPWFEKSEKARIMADGVGRKYVGKLVGRAFLDQVAADVRELLPEVFENPARKSAAAVDSGAARGVSTKGGHSYSDLPADAKTACDKFVKQKVMTREQYIKEYFELEDE